MLAASSLAYITEEAGKRGRMGPNTTETISTVLKKGMGCLTGSLEAHTKGR
jgi:hypothetical protein